MILSKVDVNPMLRQARRLLANPQAMHAAVMTACDPKPGERVLWRIDDTDAGVRLYIVSPQTPDLSCLSDQIGWPGESAASTGYDAFLSSISDGDSYAFRLTANPTHVAYVNGRKQRLGHVTVAKQRQWLIEKAAKSGFAIRQSDQRGFPEPVDDLIVHGRKVQTFRKKDRNVTLTIASYLGSLEVTNAQLLCQALVSGVGPAKAYGCGLLTLSRLK
uniref:type I-E CRISPR-associated protein Cas6/Cse3/CasE n=1 Tax=Vaginimicrobium propionicum TaxID=1871034 RepID=UPI0009705617|nr:type I-E CRISPR-associated protein Cas6/Cse3/CasE [Vaginimicrobium propionicum]